MINNELFKGKKIAKFNYGNTFVEIGFTDGTFLEIKSDKIELKTKGTNIKYCENCFQQLNGHEINRDTNLCSQCELEKWSL